MKINEHGFSLFPKEELLLVGDKNPVYSIFTGRLVKIFPEARFVCIIRDYRDNFISLLNLKGVHMEAPILSLQVARWRCITNLFIRCMETYPDRFYIIRYEDLVKDPEGSILDVCGFLGIPYHPEVFDFHQKKEEFMKTFPDPKVLEIHKSLMNPVTTGRIGIWKSALEPEEVSMADQIAGRAAHLLGYTNSTVKPRVSIFLRSLPWAIYTHVLFKLMRLGSATPYPVSRWLSLNVIRLARFHGKLTGNSR
jgi:hypothetical protein